MRESSLSLPCWLNQPQTPALHQILITMEITNCNLADLDFIFSLYRHATAYQQQRNSAVWPEFDPEMVKTEIAEKRKWKMTEDGNTVCIWATTFDDPLIWEEKNADPSVYIHRIATNPDHRGHNLVQKIVEWSKEYASAHQKKYVRLDTVGKNEKLIEHYTNSGFDYLGLIKLKNTEGLPAHYDNASVSLFELAV
jgi:GNAT superfamily N-acetyltransferase